MGHVAAPAPAPDLAVYLGEVQVGSDGLQEGEAGDELLAALPGLADGHGPLLQEEAGGGGQGGHPQGGQGGGQAAPRGQQNLVEGRVGTVMRMLMLMLMMGLMMKVRIMQMRVVQCSPQGTWAHCFATAAACAS